VGGLNLPYDSNGLYGRPSHFFSTADKHAGIKRKNIAQKNIDVRATWPYIEVINKGDRPMTSTKQTTYYLAKDIADATPLPDWALKGRQMTKAEKEAQAKRYGVEGWTGR
jgi:hypothetical protein